MKTFKNLAIASFAALFMASCSVSSSKPTSQPEIKEEEQSFDEFGAPEESFDLLVDKETFDATKKAEDRILVKPKAPGQAIDRLGKYGVDSADKLYGSDWYTCKLKKNVDPVKSVKALRESNLYDSIDFDYVLNNGAANSYEELDANPYFIEQDYLDLINAPEAWEYLEEQGVGRGGSSDVVVAVIDTGVDYNHEDLRDNMWINTGEIPNDGLDNDQNGYIDDYYGVNVVANNGFADSPETGNCMDDMGHGTHVAGIIAAADNDVGIVGIANNVKIMAIKAGNSSGYFLNSDIVEAVNYAASMGAQVINMSFGGSAISGPVKEALENAYGTCTLVAAAGNDGMPDEYYVPNLPNYPGAYPFVLGVMAENNYGVEAPFTNYDVIEDTKIEYEVYAPGVSIISTLPNNKYARWSGTSMATPVVSGMAALLRSMYPDRDVFPVKALMAQIISCSHNEVSPFPYFPSHQIPNGLDMYAALTEVPAPDVRYYNFYTFDGVEFDEAHNNGNDVVDAGETIRFGIEMKNKGGVAKNVKLSITTMRAGGVEDYYVKPVVSETTFPKIGTYSIQDGGFIYDDEHNVVDVKNYVSVKISENCPNDYICDVYLNWTWENALDESDTTIYHNIQPAAMQILVSRGTILPDVISTDMTLTNDHLWIVNHNVIVNKGVVLTIEPGTTVQWYTKETDKYITGMENVRIIVNGTLIASGSEDQPIYFQPSEYYENYQTRIEAHTPITYEYCRFTNFNPAGDYCTYYDCYFTGSAEFIVNGYHTTYATITELAPYGYFHGCHFHNMAIMYMYGAIDNCVFSKIGLDVNYSGISASSLNNNIFFTTYPDYPCSYCITHKINVSSTTTNYYDDDGNWRTKYSIQLNGNVFLYDMAVDSNTDQKLWTISTGGWGTDATGSTVYLENNYFDNMPSKLMTEIIKDYTDDGVSPILDYWTYDDLPDFNQMYPFVLDAGFYDENGQFCETIGAGKYHFIAHFSRAMDTNIELHVGFGSWEPYNDFKINGAYTSKTTWEGDYELKSAYESGQNKFRIYNGRADTDHKKELMIDTRIAFHIDTSSAQSMNLHAEANENGVVLTWDQDDYDTIAGYNLYRADELTGQYTKINGTLIPFDTTTFIDTDVYPGETYYYNFTVVLSDFTESAPSGRTSVTTFDTMAPNVYHTPVATAYIGRNLVISAQASDNVGMQYVRVYYRVAGETEYRSLEMNAFNGVYTATIAGGNITSAGIEYYIDAFDGSNHTYKGSASNPYSVLCINAVTANELGDVDGNGTITVYDALLCLKGKTGQVNLTAEQFDRADVDGDKVLTASDALRILQFANGTITSF